MNQRPQRAQLWQLVRYLLVGGFNTCFGYGLFVAFNYLFRGIGIYGSEIASLLSNVIAITVAFLGYKWFVFRTQCNYLREWLRCLSVYGTSMVFSLVMLAPLTLALRHWFGRSQLASNVAAAILTVVTVAASYFGHKYFSFRRSGDAIDAALDRGAGKAVESRP
ncbi:MAG: GtrA family protein [Acidobacteriaceae bacterium]